MLSGVGEGWVFTAGSKTKLAPAETCAAGSDSTILNVAANRKKHIKNSRYPRSIDFMVEEN